MNSKNTEYVAAAKLAIKAHALKSNPLLVADKLEREMIFREIEDAIDLTEAPEDAICSLVTDLLQYCKREDIDWNKDVMFRAMDRSGS